MRQFYCYLVGIALTILIPVSAYAQWETEDVWNKPDPVVPKCPVCQQKPCPACPACPACEQKPCPEREPCPACEQKPCPEREPCPACEQKPCPEREPCPSCPDIDAFPTCPVCPQTPCPESEPCPTCPASVIIDCSSDEENDHTGFSISTGLSVPLTFGHVYKDVSRKDNYTSVGFLADILLGYRWQYAGVYLRQQIGSTLYLGDEYNYIIPLTVEPVDNKKYDSFLTGKTMLLGKAFYPVHEDHDIYFSMGVGMSYTTNFYGVKRVASFFEFTTGIGYEYHFDNHVHFNVGLEYALSYLHYRINNKNKTYHYFMHAFIPTLSLGYTF